MAAVTLVHVARHAGVSLATASRVLNGSSRVPAAAIAARVQASAQQLGYVANAQAQALARSATALIGLVVHDIADPYFSTITRGAQRYAGERGNQVLLVAADRNEEAELAAVAAFVSYRTDAIILAGSRRTQPENELAATLDRYLRNGGRVVTLEKSTIQRAQHLDIQNRAGAADLVRALIERDVNSFAILAGPANLNTAARRVEGYHDALASAGIKPLAVVHGEFTREGGAELAVDCWQQLRPRPTQPVCLLAVNDVMALGAIAGLRSLGLSVPDDLQVAGFDDIPNLQDFTPALTTVRLPLELIGKRAIELALTPVKDVTSAVITINGQVIVRNSAGGKPAHRT